MKRKPRVVLILLVFILTVSIISINICNYNQGKNQQEKTFPFGFDIPLDNLISDSSPSEGIPNGKPLNISQHARVSKFYNPQILPQNISFTLAKNWISKNISIYYEGISKKDDYVENGRFSTELTPWSFQESDANKFIDEYNSQNGYGEILIKNQPQTASDYGYYEQYVSLGGEFAKNKLLLYSLDYYYRDADSSFNNKMSAYMAVIVDGVEKNLTIKASELEQNTWTQLNLIYNPNQEGQDLPATVVFRAGIVIDEGGTPDHDQYLRIDNVETEIWTGIEDSYIIEAYDHDLDATYPYQTTGSGNGKTIINTERQSSETQEIVITLSKNASYSGDFEIYNVTLTSSLLKVFNSTFNSQLGSKCTTGSGITWHTNIDFNIPYGYSESRADISKPLDWTFVHIYDSYDDDRINNLGSGSETTILNIPIGVLEGGLWEFEAISQNYIDSMNVQKWNGTAFQSDINYYVADIFQINAQINDSNSLLDSILNVTIYYPNGSIYWQDSEDPTTYDTTIGNFT
ncbi:MAG: exported protein of unknown function [Promethearchaeota archaeon]|nr:MAG: exported protein of unknown function [Candidatus Lokiarchaeota archaeon]